MHWRLYNPASQSLIPIEQGGGYVRVSMATSKKMFGAFADNRKQIEKAGFVVMRMPAGTYALESQMLTRTTGFVITSWGGYPTSQSAHDVYEEGSVSFTLKPGEILYAGAKTFKLNWTGAQNNNVDPTALLKALASLDPPETTEKMEGYRVAAKNAKAGETSQEMLDYIQRGKRVMSFDQSPRRLAKFKSLVSDKSLVSRITLAEISPAHFTCEWNKNSAAFAGSLRQGAYCP